MHSVFQTPFRLITQLSKAYLQMPHLAMHASPPFYGCYYTPGQDSQQVLLLWFCPCFESVNTTCIPLSLNTTIFVLFIAGDNFLSITKDALKNHDFIIYVQSNKYTQAQQSQHYHIPIKRQLWAKDSNCGMGSSLDIDGLSLDMRTFDEIVYLSSLKGLEFVEENNHQGTTII